MTPLFACPVMLVVALGCVALLLVVVAVYLLVEVAFLHGGRRSVGIAIALALLVALLCFLASALAGVQSQLVGAGITAGMLTLWLMTWPAPVVAVTLFACALALALLWRRLARQQRASVLASSLKQALDALPDAVLFADEQERVILKNVQADALDLTPQTPEGLLEQDDGSTWMVARTWLDTGERRVNETKAVDVTEEYALVARLEAHNQELAAVNARLRAYGRDVTRLVREEELLAARMRVHNEMGRALMALKAYERQAPGDRDRAVLLPAWRRVLDLFDIAALDERTADDWQQLSYAAHAVGVRLVLEGALPNASASDAAARAYRMAIEVVHECLNNAVSHADAHELHVVTRYEDNQLALMLTNDGAPPTASAEETGGLAHIRTAVERVGGTLEVVWRPTLLVRVRLNMKGCP